MDTREMRIDIVCGTYTNVADSRRFCGDKRHGSGSVDHDGVSLFATTNYSRHFDFDQHARQGQVGHADCRPGREVLLDELGRKSKMMAHFPHHIIPIM